MPYFAPFAEAEGFEVLHRHFEQFFLRRVPDSVPLETEKFQKERRFSMRAHFLAEIIHLRNPTEGNMFFGEIDPLVARNAFLIEGDEEIYLVAIAHFFRCRRNCRGRGRVEQF